MYDNNAKEFMLTDNDLIGDANKDYAPKDFEDFEDYAPMDYAPKEYAPKEYAPKEFAPKEYAPKEYAPKEYAPKDYAPKDDGKKDDGKKDDCKKDCGKDFHCKECEYIEGNSVAFELKKNDCEIRADVLVKKRECVRIWGRVKDCWEKPVEGALVKLLKVEQYKCKYQLVGVAHTVTDCKGFYQFEICGKKEHCDYRILVSKAATGEERVIKSKGCCEPCACDDKK